MVSGINQGFEPNQGPTNSQFSYSGLYSRCEVLLSMLGSCESGNMPWAEMVDFIPSIEQAVKGLENTSPPPSQKQLDLLNDIKFFLKKVANLCSEITTLENEIKNAPTIQEAEKFEAQLSSIVTSGELNSDVGAIKALAFELNSNNPLR